MHDHPYTFCTLCPRRCHADRTREVGACGMPEDLIVSRAAPHMWEEPPISGTRGSGTVFFCRVQSRLHLLPKSLDQP